MRSPPKERHPSSAGMILDVPSHASEAPLHGLKKQRNGSALHDATVPDERNSSAISSDSSASSSSATSASSALFAYRDKQTQPSTSDSVSSSSTASTSVCPKQGLPASPKQKIGHHQNGDKQVRALELASGGTASSGRDDAGSEIASPCQKQQQKQATRMPPSSSPIRTPFSPSASKTTNAQNQFPSQVSPRRLSKNRVFPTSPRRIVVGSPTTAGAKPSLQTYVELQEAEGRDEKKIISEPREVVPPLQLLHCVEPSSPNPSNDLAITEIAFNPRDQLQRHLSILSLGESINPEELQERGIRPIIDISSEEESVHDPSSNIRPSAKRGNRPSLERRLSHLTLGNESYIMDLAAQKQHREKERHEEALEETLERVQELVNAMDPSARPDPDSEEYAILFLRVLPQVKASLQRRYEDHDKQQDARLNEALMEELDRREGEKTGVEKSVCSGLADISEDHTSNAGSEKSASRSLVGMAHQAQEDDKPFSTGNGKDSIQLSRVDTTNGDRPKPKVSIKVFDRATKNRACTKIQALYRRFMIRSVFAPLVEGVHAHKRAQAQKRASIKLQACFRRYSTRKMYLSLVGLVRDRKVLEHKSAVRIQAAYRRFRTRRFYLDVIEGVRLRKVRMERKVVEYQASVKLQAACRRYLTRSFYLELVDGIKERKLQLKNKDMGRKKTRLSKSEDWIEETVHDMLLEETIHDEIIYDEDDVDGSDEDESFADDNVLELVEEIIEQNIATSTDFVDEDEESIVRDEDEAEYAEISDYSDESYVEISDDEYETEEEVVEEKAEVPAPKILDSTLSNPTPSSIQGKPRGFGSSPSEQKIEDTSVPVSDSTSEKSPIIRGIRSPAERVADRMKIFNSPQRSDAEAPRVVKRSWQKPIAKINLDEDLGERPKKDPGYIASDVVEQDGSAREKMTPPNAGNPFILNRTYSPSATSMQNTPAQRGGLSWTPWTEDSAGSTISTDALTNRPKKIWKKPQQPDSALPSVFAAGVSSTGTKKGWNNQIKKVADANESTVKKQSTAQPKTRVSSKQVAAASNNVDAETQETNEVGTITKTKRSYHSTLLKKKLIMVEKMMNACEDAKEMEKLEKKHVSYMKALAEEADEASSDKQHELGSKINSSTETMGDTKNVVKLVREKGATDGELTKKDHSLAAKSMPVERKGVSLNDKNQDEPEPVATSSPRKKIVGKVSIKRTSNDATTFPRSKLETSESSPGHPLMGLNPPIKIPENNDKGEPFPMSAKQETNVRDFKSALKKKNAGSISRPRTESLKKADENEKKEVDSRSTKCASAKTTISGDSATPAKSIDKVFLTAEVDKLSAAALSKRELSPSRPMSGRLEVNRSVASSSSFQSPLKKKGVGGEGSDATSSIPVELPPSMKFKSNVSGEVKLCSTIPKKNPVGTASPSAFQSPLTVRTKLAAEDNKPAPSLTKKKSTGPAGFQSPLKKTIGVVENSTDSGSLAASTIVDNVSINASPQKAKSSTNFIPPTSPRKFKSSGNIEFDKSPVKKPIGVKKVVSPTKQCEEPSRPPLARALPEPAKPRETATSSNIAGNGGKYYTLKDFEQKRVVGVDMAIWEQFLTDDEFRKCFEMSKEEFAIQPKWQREKQRRKIRVGF
jgi:hypothetical protein